MQALASCCATSGRDAWIPTACTASPPGSPAWLCYISTCDEIKYGCDRLGGTWSCVSDRCGSLRAWRAAAFRINVRPALQARNPLRRARGGELRGRELRPAEQGDLRYGPEALARSEPSR